MNDAEIDIRGLLGLVQRQIRLIITTVVIIVSLAGLYVFLQTPIYTASTLILVDPRQKNLLDPEMQSSSVTADNARVESEVEILRSPSTLLTMIGEERLVADAEFGVRTGLRDRIATLFGLQEAQAEPNPADLLQGVLTRFSRAVSISRRGLTYVISIDVASADPQKAARLANALADSYIRQQLEAKVASSLSARDALSRRLTRAASEINEIEQKIDGFVSSNLDSIANESNRADIAALRAQLDSLSQQSTANTALAASIGQLAAAQDWTAVSESLQSEALAELTRQREQLASRFSDAASGSAQAIDLRGQLARLDQELVTTVNDELGRIRLQTDTAQAEEDRLREQIRTTIMSSDLPNDLLVQLFQLQQEADVTRNQYQGLLQRLREVEAQAELQLPDSRVVSLATAPTTPTSPKVMLILGLAGIASLGLGFAAAFLTENYIGGFGSPEQVEAVLGVPAVSTLPLLSSASKAGGGRTAVVDEIVKNPLSAYSEAVRRVRLGVETMARPPAARGEGGANSVIVMVASAIPGEGKTTTASALGRAFALAGKRTLLIDCDLRRPAVAAALGIEKGFGLMDFLADRVDVKGIKEFLAVDEVSGLEMILGGRRSHIPTDTLLSSDRFKRLLTISRETFEVIILDTPPVLPVTDAQYLAPMTDMILLVAKWSSTPQREIAAAVNALRGAAGHEVPVGLVLSQAEAMGTSYSKKYGSYYTSSTY